MLEDGESVSGRRGGGRWRQHSGVLVAMRWRELPTPARFPWADGGESIGTTVIGVPKRILRKRFPTRARSAVLAETPLLLGDNLLPLLVLALGGAMAVGSILALVRPPAKPTREGDLPRAPLVRTVIFASVGLLAALWAFASLVAG